MRCYEDGVIQKTVIYCPPDIVDTMETEIGSMACLGCMWTNLDENVPNYANPKDRKVLK